MKIDGLLDFYDRLPQHELELTLMLQKIIKTTLPQSTEYIHHEVLFFSIETPICFIWPSSIPIPNVPEDFEGVRLGFTRGRCIKDPTYYLTNQGQKLVFWKDIEYVEDIDQECIKSFLLQSIEM